MKRVSIWIASFVAVCFVFTVLETPPTFAQEAEVFIGGQWYLTACYSTGGCLSTPIKFSQFFLFLTFSTNTAESGVGVTLGPFVSLISNNTPCGQRVYSGLLAPSAKFMNGQWRCANGEFGSFEATRTP